MKLLFGGCLVAVLSLVCAAGGAQRQVRPAETGAQAARDYVRVADWAKANKFEARWVKRDETVQLSGASTRVLLTVDSRDAMLNGVKVRLLFPVIERDGMPCLSRLDAQTTFQPILYPPRLRGGNQVKTVCLDAGHGGKDPGFCVGGNQEKRYTLLLTEELRAQLKRAGFKVSLTRSSDTFIEPASRPEVANRRKVDLFVSLHFNATEGSPGLVQGAEVYCLTPAGAPSTNAGGEGGNVGSTPGNRYNDFNMYLAYQAQKALTRGLAMEDRGVHRARFAVLRDAAMPAVLIEAGFMSHPIEGRKIFTVAYRRQIAQAIVDGILAYKRTVEQGRA
jgi:N-acetylmuramoyl-L-alanine amidase